MCTLEEFQAGVQRGEKWTIYDGHVIDLRGFIDHHPGGKVIDSVVGVDCTIESLQQHLLSHEKLNAVMAKHCIGKLSDYDVTKFRSSKFVLSEEMKILVHDFRESLKKKPIFDYSFLHVVCYWIIWMASVYFGLVYNSLIALVVFLIFLRHPLDLYEHFDGHFCFVPASPKRMKRLASALIHFVSLVCFGSLSPDTHWYYENYLNHNDSVTEAGKVEPSNHYYHHAFTGIGEDMIEKMAGNRIVHDTDQSLHFMCCPTLYGAIYPLIRSVKYQEHRWFHKYQWLYGPLFIIFLYPGYSVVRVCDEVRGGLRKKLWKKVFCIIFFSAINPWIPVLPFLCLPFLKAFFLVYICQVFSNILYTPYHIAQHYLSPSAERTQEEVDSENFDFLKMQVYGSASLRSNFFLDQIVGLIDPGLQTEHHIFPAAPFTILPRLTEILEKKKIDNYRLYSWSGAWNAYISRLCALGDGVDSKKIQ